MNISNSKKININKKLVTCMQYITFQLKLRGNYRGIRLSKIITLELDEEEFIFYTEKN